MVEGNYSVLWKGKHNGGPTKKQICKPIITDMIATGVRVERNAKQVESKIAHMEQQFQKTYDFSHNKTSVGMKETDKGKFNNLVTKRCKYYVDLESIMGDQASAGPMATSEENLGSDDDSVIGRTKM
jgi:hypothetical protein